MPLSNTAQDLYDQLAEGPTQAGLLKKQAKVIKTNHALGLELWSTGALNCRF